MIKTHTPYQPPDDRRPAVLAGTPLASFTRRGTALFIDFTVAAVTFMILTVGGGILIRWTGFISFEQDVMLQFTFFRNWYSVVWLVLYFTMSVYLGDGLTVGKRICRIRVVSLVHDHIGLWHAFERALGYGASTLEAGFGFFQYFLRPDRRTIHDRIAETIVIAEPVKMKGNRKNIMPRHDA